MERLVGLLGDPQLGRAGDPHHRHQRQGHGRGDDHRAACRRVACRSAPTRARTSTGSTSGSSRNGEPISDEELAETLDAVMDVADLLDVVAELVRDRHRRGIPLVRRGRGRRDGRRGRAARALRRHQRGRVDGRGDHERGRRPHRLRPGLGAGRSHPRRPGSSSRLHGGGGPRQRRGPGGHRGGGGAQPCRRARPRDRRSTRTRSRWVVTSCRSPRRGAPTSRSTCRSTARRRRSNTVVATAAVEAFFDRALSDDVCELGLASVSLPGRCEVVLHQPLVILDGAHNRDAAAHLVDTLSRRVQPGRLAHAGARHVVGSIARPTCWTRSRPTAGTRWSSTTPPGERGLSASELARAVSRRWHVEADVDRRSRRGDPSACCSWPATTTWSWSRDRSTW